MVNDVNGLGAAGNAVTRVGSDVAKSAPKEAPASQPASAAVTDTITLTQSARVLQQLEDTVRGTTGVDQSSIDKIKQQITAGEYTVNIDRIAEQLATFDKEITRSVEITRNENGYTREGTITGPEGSSLSRSVSVSYDAENKTLTRETILTGPEGNSVSREGQLSRVDGGFLKQVSVTGGTGETTTYSAKRMFGNVEPAPAPAPVADQLDAADSDSTKV